jgi:hypothetical protein
MSLNLHRLDNKIKPYTIDQLPFPVNCDFHIMDNMCDPESWNQPLTSSRYIIHRTIGLHPKYSAPEPFYDEFPQVLHQLLSTNFFEAISTGIENHNNTFNCIANLYKTKITHLPLYIHSRNDIEIIKQIQEDHFATIPIIWQNINLGSTTRLDTLINTTSNTSIHSFLETNENHFLCLNPLINSHPIHKLKQLINPILSERILASTDAPHNVFTQKNIIKAEYNQPIHIIRTIIQMHYQLTHINKYKHYHLYETNEWLFNKALNIFPNHPTQSATQFKLIAKNITKNILDNWSKRIKYDKKPDIQSKQYDNNFKQTLTNNKNSNHSTNNNNHNEQHNLLIKTTLNKSTQTFDTSFETSTCTKCINNTKKFSTTQTSTQTSSESYPITSSNKYNIIPPNNDTASNESIITMHQDYPIQTQSTITSMAIDIQLSPRTTSTQLPKHHSTLKENIQEQKNDRKRQSNDPNNNISSNTITNKKYKRDNFIQSNQPSIIHSLNARKSLEDKLNNNNNFISTKTNSSDDQLDFLDEKFFDDHTE